MAWLVMYVQFLAEVINLFTVVVFDGIGNIPLGYLAVNKQGGISVATAIKRCVQRPKTQLGLGNNHITQADFVIKQVIQLIDGNHRTGGRQLASSNEVLAIG